MDRISVMASDECKAFITKYTDKNGKLSYQLMNKDLIQFASKSSIVRKMLSEKTDVDVIVKYIVNSKATSLSGNNGMSDEMLTVFINTFDSMNTRSAFKELKEHLRGKLSRRTKS